MKREIRDIKKIITDKKGRKYEVVKVGKWYPASDFAIKLAKIINREAGF